LVVAVPHGWVGLGGLADQKRFEGAKGFFDRDEGKTEVLVGGSRYGKNG
jgi:hypothetical protein